MRQRCGFGCVICGFPLYEYDHIIGWAKVHRHDVAEIALLCDQHHREKTSGLLPLEIVIDANNNPFNHRTGVTKPYDLHYTGKECQAIIGGNLFTTEDQGYGTVQVPLCVDETPLIGFIMADGHLLLNLNLFDEFNNLILQIKNNQLWYSIRPWDIHLVGRNLTIREASRKILIDLTFEVPNKILVNRGRFLRNGVEIIIMPDHLLITNSKTLLSGTTVHNVPYGLVIGSIPSKAGCCLHLEKVSRYLGDNSEALRWARENFEKFQLPEA